MGNRSLETYRQQQERSRSKSKSSPKESSSSATRASPRGHRSSENRRQSGSSSRAQHDSSSGSGGGVQVAALDEKNLKRAVNRYGTMPKGARIGAYLESLRQSGMTPEPVTDAGVDSDATLDSSSQGGDTMETHPRQQSSLGRSKPVSAAAAAQMLRSNSSHGGFGGGRGSGSPVQRTTPNNQLRRALTSGIDTPMRGATAAHQVDSTDFLPPPPHGLAGDAFEQLPAPPPNFLSSVAGRRPSPSPRTRRKDVANKENLPERLKSSRNRGGGGGSESGEDSEPDRALYSPAAVQAASAISPVSECRTLGSPAVGSLSSPGSTMNDGRMKNASAGGAAAEAIRPFNKANLELKLVDELKSRDAARDQHSQSPANEGGNPAAQLVTELFESIKAKSSSTTQQPPGRAKSPLQEKQSELDDSRKHEVDFKANLRKVKRPDPSDQAEPNSHEIDFKSSLKKTNTAEKKASAAAKADSASRKSSAEGLDESNATNIVDFKAKLKKPKPMVPAEVANAAQYDRSSAGDEQINFKARLRKVSGNKTVVTVMQTDTNVIKNGDNGQKETKDTAADAAAEISAAPDEDKRKSTGSISSLRRMWESSDQQSPSLGGRKASKTSPDSQPTSPTDPNGETRSTTVKFEKRVWPPVSNTETEKPMVPVKPTMKVRLL
jgi:abelson tyrosine-protein kinase 1